MLVDRGASRDTHRAAFGGEDEGDPECGTQPGPEAAEALLTAALRGGPEDVRAHLEFLSPAIQYAKTGDKQALARLPEPERDAAKKIAASILEKKGVSAANATAVGMSGGQPHLQLQH